MEKRSPWSTEKKEFLIFMGIAFGLSYLMALPWGIARHLGRSDVANSVQVLYPAFGVILAKYLCEKDRPLLPRESFRFYILWVLSLSALTLATFFLPESISTGIHGVIGIWILLGGLVFVAYLFTEQEEKRRAYGLLGGNWKTSLLLVAVFVLIVLAYIVGSSFLESLLPSGMAKGEPFSAPDTQSQGLFAWLYFLFYAAFLGIFSEEYGWRYFLQPILQRRLGPVRGVLLLGVLWELWHLPFLFLNLGGESGSLLAKIEVMRLASVILLAFPIGYIYLKTRNVWAATLAHSLYDLVLLLPSDGSSGETGIYWLGILIVIAVQSVFCLPFAFLISREYKAQEMAREQEALPQSRG